MKVSQLNICRRYNLKVIRSDVFFFLWTKAKVVKVLISRKRITERSKKAISVIKCINLTKEAVKVSGVFYSYDRKIELEKKVSKSPT